MEASLVVRGPTQAGDSLNEVTEPDLTSLWLHDREFAYKPHQASRGGVDIVSVARNRAGRGVNIETAVGALIQPKSHWLCLDRWSRQILGAYGLFCTKKVSSMA